MSLPPGFLDELRTRLSLSDVVGRKVMWDSHKSNQAKGDMWAPCPFHQEKTASFHVDDRKGYYYCFGCHAKGDAITFVRETENVGFMEAVEILAGEAGMQMPASDPRAREKADRRTQLHEVMELAVQFFRLQLQTGAGSPARQYLAGRGLQDEALARWEIGYAPGGWQALWDHLRGKSVDEDLILAAGLAKPSNRGGKPYDTFRDRIMFPIRDARGRAIAFGGRAMDPDDKAKYLNSPETELFDKGRSLYNHARAREAAGKGAPLIVAEGYMDVIALSEAGFTAAVAPLGTAVTEHQLAHLWRISPEPTIALDGDRAGMAAALRVIDLSLPLIEAGQSLRFAVMPPGQDPDDVIRAAGPPAIAKLLDEAKPMVQLLWQRETEGKSFDSPERKAALDKDLRAAIGRIKDPSIRQHYGEEIRNLRWQLFRMARPQGQGKRGGRFAPRGPAVLSSTKGSALAAADDQFPEALREAVILAGFVTHPTLITQFEGPLEVLDFTGAEHQRLQNALLRHAEADNLRAELEADLGTGPLENLFALRHVQISPPQVSPQNTEKAALCLGEEIQKLQAARGSAREVAEAVQDIDGLADEGLTWRLSQAAEARNSAGRSGNEERGEFEVGPNGARMDKEERNAFDELLNQIGFGQDADKGP
ncbi:DNA primase [Actibacterium mucosum KCTC 23349]|uniref:DNA primase n=1 Tax=Actibacterium mucosum KCTC 23349 TaxID=1454373 RepID=A0A037ZI72_9RHOB|nr:DNA primase [Actibacterium mucosum]KAJ55309.1 DNA primase [Actibacterium mucosum KCTC 23349]